MCATYFAKVDLEIVATNKDLKSLRRNFTEVESTFINPGKILEAKMFSIN